MSTENAQQPNSNPSAGSAKLPVSRTRRHKWRVQGEDGSYRCVMCGIRMMNVWMSGMRNGKAAIYFLHDGTRTSYRPDCG